ncbi:MAG: hypothetical protein NC130_02670, partial [Lachnoclostridium sp.]|nr:hypothetical protein [Lachnoclostridium sp.]
FKTIAVGEGVAKPRPNPRLLSETGDLERRPAGAFENTNRGVERYAVARSNTADDYNDDTPGSANATPRATILKRIRASSPL